jgi:hypothetical protein
MGLRSVTSQNTEFSSFHIFYSDGTMKHEDIWTDCISENTGDYVEEITYRF